MIKRGKKKIRNAFSLGRLVAITIVSVLAVVCFTAYADLDSADAANETSGSCGSNLNWTYDSASGLLTISGNGSMNDYSWNSSRWGNNDVNIVIINNGVTSIGDYAFSECTSLASVTIPNSVTYIGSDAFSECTSLISVTIPDSVTTIGGDAFSGCTSLTSITLGNSVTSIGNYAFYKCTSIESINVSDSNTRYSSECGVLFNKDKTSLICYPAKKSDTSYTIPDSVTTIEVIAFSGCTSLTSITIPDSVTTIEVIAFSGCTSLTSITIPDSVTSIGEYAFMACASLESVNVDNFNTKYSSEDGVLFNKDKTELIIYPAKKSGTSYTIPDSVTSIRDYAFSGCSSLASVTISDGVDFIGDYAFSGCTFLEFINVGKLNTEYLSEDGVLFNKDKTKLICYPAKKSDASYTIPDSVTSIGYYAFSECTFLEFINVGKLNTEYLSEDGVLFNKDKTKLICYPAKKSDASYTIPDSVTSIRYYAFSGCSFLESINVGESNTEYLSEDGVLFNIDKTELICYPAKKSDASYTIPDSVFSIREYAFSGCTSLTSVTIPDSITAIGGCTFSGCTSLTSVILPDSTILFGNDVFSGCAGLVSVTVDDNSITIESGKTANVFHVKDDYSTGVTVTWVSSDESVATVDSTGVITAVRSGTAVIKAVCGERVYSECNVTVPGSVSDGDSAETESKDYKLIATGVTAAIIILFAAVLIFRRLQY